MAAHLPRSPRQLTPRGLASQRFLTRLHIDLYRATGGILGHHLGTVPCLLLTTIGRKTGQPRVTPLAYVVDTDRYILIASNGGTVSDPIWWRNLLANPEATIQVGRRIMRVTASVAGPDERPRLWAKAVAMYHGYAGYQQGVTREIPVVILRPVVN